MPAIRVDAAVLENTVDDHIRATDDDARQLADARMEETLADAKEARLAYTQGLPEGEKELWKRFDETARALAQSARVALRFSNRREAERARQHLEAELRPIAEQLNGLAGELAHKDAQETRALLHRRESLRTKTTFVGALVALSAWRSRWPSAPRWCGCSGGRSTPSRSSWPSWTGATTSWTPSPAGWRTTWSPRCRRSRAT